ncbi:MAG: hypothetical protein NTV31_09120 [Bacteroidia bacterium]|nr:hypothetical protein [Bacteroidia bacterium]
MQNKTIIFILISLFSFAITVNGQKLINSPYSRFNIGTLEPAGSFRSLGMGGVGTAFRDNSSIYFSNPASYSSIDTNSFVFDFGVDYGKDILSDGVSSYFSYDINFDHLVISFPVAKGLGIAAGIIPLSNGYYKMSESVLENNPEYDPIIGEYTSNHAGDGGFTNFFIGSGISLNKNFSVGVNMTVLFGQINRINQFEFADFNNVFNDNSTEKLRLGGINFDYGIQYTASLKNDFFLNAGVSLNSGKNYSLKYEHLSYKYSPYNTRDTISYISDDLTKAFIPGTLRFGISFGKKNKFTTGIDYVTAKWSNSKIPGANGYAADARSLLFGAEFIPDKFSNYSFLKRLEYRIGGHIGDNYLIINGEQVKEYGASIGIGLPMRPAISRSKANLFFDFTRKTGSTASNLHTENFYTMGISLNLYDFWFLKRKYD